MSDRRHITCGVAIPSENYSDRPRVAIVVTHTRPAPPCLKGHMTMMALLVLLIASAAAADIVMITHGPPDVSLPRETTDNRPARYGIGLPLQVSATEAAVFCNLRAIGPG